MDIANLLYDFIELDVPAEVKSWVVQYHLRNNTDHGHQYSTNRNSTHILLQWRFDLNIDIIQKLQHICYRPMHQLGYILVNNTEDILNLSLNFVK